MKPIQAGDICQVIAGLGNQISPNLGVIVKVISAQGEHSRFGRIWRCEGEGVKQLHDSGNYIDLGWADFAQDWLRKIDPVSLSRQIEKAVTA